MADLTKVRQIKDQHENEWIARREVTAVGIGKAGGEIGIVLSVSENPDKMKKEIGERIDGVPIKIQQTGTFKAQ